MFTGLVAELGTVQRLARQGNSYHLTVDAKKVLNNLKIGDSVAVNGACLTVVRMDEGGFTADVMPETLRRTNLGRLGAGSRVNLERAMAADGRFGGHIVSGHIDGVGTIRSQRREENAVWLTIAAPKDILDLIVMKGSIAIDGVSLTVADLTGDTFAVSIIPHTGAQTILLGKRPGDQVNLENDVIGKYVRRLLEPYQATAPKSGGITEEFLLQYGF